MGSIWVCNEKGIVFKLYHYHNDSRLISTKIIWKNPFQFPSGSFRPNLTVKLEEVCKAKCHLSRGIREYFPFDPLIIGELSLSIQSLVAEFEQSISDD